MSMLAVVWVVSLSSVLLVGFAFGVSSGRERERRRWLGRKRTCSNCSGWGYIRTGLPLFGLSWPCCDCHGVGYRRDSTTAPSTVT